MKIIGAVILCVLWGGCLLWLSPVCAAAAARYPQSISQDYMAGLATEKIEQALAAAQETRRHELRLVRQPQAMRLPAGQLICEVELPHGLNFSGQTPVVIKAYVDDQFYRQAVLYYQVRLYAPVLVATHDLQLERALTAADVKCEERCLENAQAEYLTDVKELGDSVPIRFIKGGTLITRNMLTTPIVVQSGAPVKLVTQLNGVAVQTEGVAMQRGRRGAIIRVRNARSGKVLRGRVIDATTVEIAN